MADSVIEMAAAVRRGDVSPRDLVDEALERIDAHDGALNCFVAVDAERRPRRGRPRSRARSRRG